MRDADPPAAQFALINELLTTRLAMLAAGGAALVFALNAGLYAVAIAGSNDLLTPYGMIIGGDFVAFETAAEAAARGEANLAYDAAAFADRLAERFPARGGFNLNWPYPPTMFLATAPLALVGYLTGYWLWVIAGLASLCFATRSLTGSPLALFAVIASPAAYLAVITGQTGLFTAALALLAASEATRRPLIAGVAAGLLTMKPQLGLLIPVAFAAGGCWRAFAVAAVTALALALAASGIFGAGIWQAFLASMGEHGARLQSAAFPFEKLVSVFGGARTIGLPFSAALALQGIAILSLAAVVGAFWRASSDAALRTALLCAAIPLATPYAMYYELPLMLPALIVLAVRGAERGWLAGEKIAVGALWLAPMFILSLPPDPGAPLGFMTSAALFALVLRRLHAEGCFPAPALSLTIRSRNPIHE